MSIYKLAIPKTQAIGDAVASLDIQFDGHITVIDWAVASEGNANDDGIACEVSFGSTNTFGINDSRQSISMVRNTLKDITAETGFNGINKCVTGLRIPVAAGERLFLHCQDTLVAVDVYLHVDDTSDPRIRRRR